MLVCRDFGRTATKETTGKLLYPFWLDYCIITYGLPAFLSFNPRFSDVARYVCCDGLRVLCRGDSTDDLHGCVFF
jgi:hypothetical protein